MFTTEKVAKRNEIMFQMNSRQWHRRTVAAHARPQVRNGCDRPFLTDSGPPILLYLASLSIGIEAEHGVSNEKPEADLLGCSALQRVG